MIPAILVLLVIGFALITTLLANTVQALRTLVALQVLEAKRTKQSSAREEAEKAFKDPWGSQ